MIDLPPPPGINDPQPEQPADPAPDTDATLASDAPAPAAESPEICPKTGKKRRVNFDSIAIAQQVFQVQEWLSLGKRPNQIRRLCADEWGLSFRTAESRIQMARRQMVTDANVMDRQEKVGQMLQQLEQVLEQALAMRQGSNAIGALRLQADLLQLISRSQ
jgi:hypothetical protein